jgi:hypothetical protein
MEGMGGRRNGSEKGGVLGNSLFLSGVFFLMFSISFIQKADGRKPIAYCLQ